MSKTETTFNASEVPETLYLIDMGDDGLAWCSDPQPDFVKRDAWEYKLVRKSHHAK